MPFEVAALGYGVLGGIWEDLGGLHVGREPPLYFSYNCPEPPSRVQHKMALHPKPQTLNPTRPYLQGLAGAFRISMYKPYSGPNPQVKHPNPETLKPKTLNP